MEFDELFNSTINLALLIICWLKLFFGSILSQVATNRCRQYGISTVTGFSTNKPLIRFFRLPKRQPKPVLEVSFGFLLTKKNEVLFASSWCWKPIPLWQSCMWVTWNQLEDMCWGLNSHCFFYGKDGHQPYSIGVYTYISRFYRDPRH